MQIPYAITSRNCTAFSAHELNGSIVDRFRTIVARHSQVAAIKDGALTLNYEALDDASEQIAQTLLQLFGDDQEPVAMLYKPGAVYHAAQLAVLRIGKFYAGLDYELHPQRRETLLDDLGARILLCDDHCFAKAIALTTAFPELKVVNTERLTTPEGRWPIAINRGPSDNACIVYTSGSTGAPRGVVLTHGNILNLARNHGKDFGLNSYDKASQLCPLWTAAGVSEIFSALLNGVTLLPFSIREQGIEAFLRLIVEEGVTTVTASPVLFRALFSDSHACRTYPSVRLIRLGGDRATILDFRIYQRHFADSCVLRIGYGSTEFMQATQLFIDKTYEPNGNILPVGFPMRDCGLPLLDDAGNAVAPEHAGEIAISSSNLSKGYWRNPALTGTRFVRDTRAPARSLYLTRDIGYQDINGCLHHLGRKDARVKLHGKLVLVSDIEQALLGIKGVSDAVVIPFDSGERGTELAAFVVLANTHLSIMPIRAELANSLGRELVPAKFSVLDEMPVQSTNKVDRLKLKAIADERYGCKLSIHASEQNRNADG